MGRLAAGAIDGGAGGTNIAWKILSLKMTFADRDGPMNLWIARENQFMMRTRSSVDLYRV